jgi:hypothetical protein
VIGMILILGNFTGNASFKIENASSVGEGTSCA